MDVAAIRKDFPVLSRRWERRPPLVYLDSGCMSLKPRQVIDAVTEYYELHSACGGRSVHTLASEVSRRVARSRAAIGRFIGASSAQEVVFVRNTTEGLNTVARGLPLARGDAVLITDREHNSNLLPWMRLVDTTGITLRVVPSEEDGTISTDRFQEEVARGDVRVVAISHANNLDGYAVPLGEVADIAHDAGAVVVADGAQSAPSRPVDVGALGVDFFTFSVHKMLGPTGMGVLWGREGLLADLPPHNVGGGTVSSVDPAGATYDPPPGRFEAGLQDYAGIYGAEAAVRYLEGLGMDRVWDHEVELNRRATEAVGDIPGVRVVGPPDPELRGGVLTLVVDGVDSHEVGMALDEMGNVAVRTGRHCNHAWFDSRGIEGAVRATFYVYNDTDDVDRFASTLSEALDVLRSSKGVHAWKTL